MGVFDSDDDKCAASCIRSVFRIMPPAARDYVMSELDGEAAANVRAALAASGLM
jgi:hypothetical protein